MKQIIVVFSILLISFLISNVYGQDTVLVKGFYILRYKRSEIESKEKNKQLKLMGEPYSEPIDYEKSKMFIPITDISKSLLKSIDDYRYEYSSTNFYLPQDSHAIKYLSKIQANVKQEARYFKNEVLYSSDLTPEYLYYLYYVEGTGLKYHLANKKENRQMFGLFANDVTKEDFFDVVLLYQYTMVTQDFIHLKNFSKWKYQK